MLWSVNKLARAVAKWTRACDKRLACLISYIHHTSDHRQYCHVGNTAQHCRLGLFQDSDFAGDLDDSKSTSGGKEGEGGEGRIRCIFGSHTFVLISWMCKKQTSVSRSFAWTVSHFPGHTTLELFHEIERKMAKERIRLEEFKDRIIFMSMYSKKHVSNAMQTDFRRDTGHSSDQERKKKVWNAHLQARRFADQISRDHNADPGESGHPVFRATSALDRGSLKSKKGGKLSIHFDSDL